VVKHAYHLRVATQDGPTWRGSVTDTTRPGMRTISHSDGLLTGEGNEAKYFIPL